MEQCDTLVLPVFVKNISSSKNNVIAPCLKQLSSLGILKKKIHTNYFILFLEIIYRIASMETEC